MNAKLKKLLLSLRDNDLLYAALIFLVGALAYLLLIKRLGLYGDDWYLIFDGHTQGPAFFHIVFSSDRPARGYLMRLVYTLFGDHLVYYHLSAFLSRFLASMALYWTLNMVWKQNKFPNFLVALFFLIYPGFLAQLQPVDYQSQICSLFLAMVSIALTVKAVQIKTPLVLKITIFAVSVLTGWFYLALVEYFIGMEFLRLFFVACLVWQERGGTLKQKMIKPLLRWLPSSIVPAGFLIWRVFVFKSTRAATDISLQLGAFFASPLLVGLHWLINWVYGTFNTIFSAWVVPFYNIVVMGGFRLHDSLLIFVVATGALIVLFLGLQLGRPGSKDEQASSIWIQQAIWGGLIAVLVGVIPVIMTNRTVDFEGSRYMLAGAPGAIMMLVAGISLIKSSRLQLGLVGLLVFLSVAMHFCNALDHVYQADSLREFWWQVSWRAPSIEVGTNLVVSYPYMDAPENYVIWGPANLIYYPEKQEVMPIRIPLPASILSRETVTGILGNGEGRGKDERSNIVNEDFSAVLVMTQPDIHSCVRILDGTMPELSTLDRFEIMLIAPYSLLGNVNIAETSPIPPAAIFGPEPQHGWCYYYEKAAWASQIGDWSSVISLGQEASQKGFSPADIVEWTPFLRAYVATGQMDALEPYSSIMKTSRFIFNQTCQILEQTANQTRPGDLELMGFIQAQFCPLP